MLGQVPRGSTVNSLYATPKEYLESRGFTINGDIATDTNGETLSISKFTQDMYEKARKEEIETGKEIIRFGEDFAPRLKVVK